MYRASDVIAAQQPWQFELGGTVYTARLVSEQQLLAYYAELEAIGDGPGVAQLRVVRAAQRRLFRVAFPRHPPWRRRDPVDLLFAQDTATLRGALDDFFAYLARSHAATTPRTNGPASAGS